MRKFCIRGIFLAICSALLFFCAVSLLKDRSTKSVVALAESVEWEYAVGETVDFPSASEVGLDVSDYKISVQYVTEEGARVEKTFTDRNASYCFLKEGTYHVAYEWIVDGKTQLRTFNVITSFKAYVDMGEIPNVVSPNTTIELDALLIDGELTERCSVGVKLPDGSVRTPTNTFMFDTPGKYVFTASVEKDGIVYTKKKEVECSLQFSDLFFGNFLSFEQNVDSPAYFRQPCNGVQMTVPSGATIRYVNPLNLNEFDGTKNLFAFAPIVKDVAYFKQISVKLTDVNDPTNVLEIRFNDAGGFDGIPWNYMLSYLMVGTGGKLGGYQQGSTINYNPYGTVVMNSFNGGLHPEYNQGYEKTDLFSVQFDYAEKKVYTLCKQFSEGTPALVMDLTDRKLNSDGWKGFSTGEVWIDFCFPTATSGMTVLMTEVGGVSLSGEKILDKVKPVIWIDAEEEYVKNGFPDALVGKEYPVPNAVAKDFVTGNGEVLVEVQDPSGNPVVLANGKILPTEEGRYNVTYVASDAYGNEERISFSFEAKKNLPKRSVLLSSEEEFFAGSPFLIPPIEVRGYSEVVDYDVRLELDGEVLHTDEDGYYCAEKSGTMRIWVEITDFLGSERLYIDVPMRAPTAPVITVKNVPVAAFKGTLLQLPDFTAKDYANGELCRKSVYVNGVRLDESLQYFVKDTDEALTVEYLARSGEAESVKVFKISVLASTNFTETIVKEGYVQSELRGTDGVAFTSDKDFVLSLPAPVLFNNLSLEFKLQAANAKYIEIKARDFETRNKTLLFTISPNANDASTVKVSLNGSENSYSMSGSFTDGSLTINMLFQEGNLYSNGIRILDIECYENGKLFDDFKGEKVLIDIAMKGVTDTSSLLLYKVANQSFMTLGNFKSDSGPVLSYSYAASNKTVGINEKILLPTVDAFDVLTGDCESYVEVTAPNGEIVIDATSAKTATSFTAMQYGKYTVRYSATDRLGNRTEETYTYEVIDMTPPELIVNGSVNTSYRVGEEIAVPKVIAVDEYDGNVTLLAYVLDGRYTMTAIPVNGSFTLNKIGKYTLVYVAYDSEANVARLEMDFEITA